jgi:hypothetical protein
MTTPGQIDRRVKYDIALSFAGEDRTYVAEIAECLRSRGVRVFYDKYEEASLWGKDLYSHLCDVYQNQALFTIIFVSSSYTKKLWTNLERQSAQARAFEEHREYILPVRVDDTDVPGLLRTVGYIDLRDRTPAQLCELVEEKLRLLAKSSSLRPRHILASKDAGELDAEYASLEMRKYNQNQDLGVRILIDPDSYLTIGEMLDDLFIHYLSDTVQPYSYGSEWLIASGGEGFSNLVLVPLIWIGQPLQPVHGIAASWLTSVSPKDLGMSRGTKWTICLIKESNQVSHECWNVRAVYALGCNTSDMRKRLLRHSKAAYLLLRDGYLARVTLEDFRPEHFKHVDVVTDWLDIATGAALVETGVPPTNEIKALFRIRG